MTGTVTPTTVRELVACLAPFSPEAEGEEVTLTGDLPPALAAALGVLHTGVRAMLTGRRWCGCDGATGRVAVLNPAAPIPAGVTLLCVEGDSRWDRITRSARADYPRLFAPAPAAGPPGGGGGPRPHRKPSPDQTN